MVRRYGPKPKASRIQPKATQSASPQIQAVTPPMLDLSLSFRASSLLGCPDQAKASGSVTQEDWVIVQEHFKKLLLT